MVNICAVCGEEFNWPREVLSCSKPGCRHQVRVLARRTGSGTGTRRPGNIKCLRCDKYFHSWNQVKNRICPDCHAAWRRSEECRFCLPGEE